MGAVTRLERSNPSRPVGISDADLVARARRGDRSAQTALYRRHSRRAAHLAARLLGSRQDVEDITHDAFVDALTGLDRLRDPAAFRSWLLRIVVLKVRQKIRRRRITRRLGLDRPADDATLERLAAADVTAEQRAELSLIDDELRRASVDDRLAWMLAHVEGYTLAEIASLSDCSVTTVKRRLKRAALRVSRWVELEGRAE